MFKKKIILILFFFFINSNVLSSNEVFIRVYVDNKIITNIDIKKESEYLKILNPNLNELEEKNHFFTNSDTEVLFKALQAWGKNALDKIEGQFSFVFFSHHKNDCVLGS